MCICLNNNHILDTFNIKVFLVKLWTKYTITSLFSAALTRAKHWEKKRQQQLAVVVPLCFWVLGQAQRRFSAN